MTAPTKYKLTKIKLVLMFIEKKEHLEVMARVNF